MLEVDLERNHSKEIVILRHENSPSAPSGR